MSRYADRSHRDYPVAFENLFRSWVQRRQNSGVADETLRITNALQLNLVALGDVANGAFYERAMLSANLLRPEGNRLLRCRDLALQLTSDVRVIHHGSPIIGASNT